MMMMMTMTSLEYNELAARLSELFLQGQSAVCSKENFTVCFFGFLLFVFTKHLASEFYCRGIVTRTTLRSLTTAVLK